MSYSDIHTLSDVQSLPAGSAEKLKVYLFHIRESMTVFGRAENRWYSILQSVLSAIMIIYPMNYL